MGFHENPPWKRGDTFFGIGGTADSASGSQYEGREYWMDDEDMSASTSGSAGIKSLRTNHKVRVKVVRNTDTSNMLPKRLVTFEATAGADGIQQVNGYSRLTAQRIAGVVDEWLPAVGVAPNDLFYIVIEGPTRCLMPLSNLGADVAVGDQLVSITAAASTSTTAGRLGQQDLTGATALLADQIRHAVGRAMSTALTNSTNSDLLVHIGRFL